MSKLPNKEFRAMVPLLREKEFYEPEEQREISWPEYNSSQIDDAYETLAFIREFCRSSTIYARNGKDRQTLNRSKNIG